VYILVYIYTRYIYTGVYTRQEKINREICDPHGLEQQDYDF